MTEEKAPSNDDVKLAKVLQIASAAIILEEKKAEKARKKQKKAAVDGDDDAEDESDKRKIDRDTNALIDALADWRASTNFRLDSGTGQLYEFLPASGLEEFVPMNWAADRARFTPELEDRFGCNQGRYLNALRISINRHRDGMLHMLQRKIDCRPEERTVEPGDWTPIREILKKGLDDPAIVDKDAFEDQVTAWAQWGYNIRTLLKHGDDHNVLLPLLHSNVQGTGKTEFVRQLCKPVFGDFYVESHLALLFEKFGALPFSYARVVLLDELDKGSEKHRSDIKRLMSCRRIPNRGMATENAPMRKRTATLIGTCNDIPRDVIGDNTGARRFWPVPFTRRLMTPGYFWDELITEQDSLEFFQCLDMAAPFPIHKRFVSITATQRKELKKRDRYESFVDEELVTVETPAMIPMKSLKNSFRLWCDANNDREKIPVISELVEKFATFGVVCEYDKKMKNYFVTSHDLRDTDPKRPP